MPTVILLRHAKAAPADGAQPDHARDLTARGRRDASAVGVAVRACGLAPTLVLVSTATRTRQTWEAVSDAFPSASAQLLDELYTAAPGDLWRLLSSASPADTVLVVGHNPTMHEVAAELALQCAEQSPAHRAIQSDFPTSAWAAFAYSGDTLQSARPRLIASDRPQK